MSDYPVSAKLKEQFTDEELRDRFYLEELWKSLNEEFNVPLTDDNGWKSTTFLRDWLTELIQKVPISREDREAYIAEQYMPEWFPTWDELKACGVLPEEEEPSE